MPTIKELIQKGATHIHNKNAPPGVFIELIRREDKTVKEFKTHFPNGNFHLHVADDRSHLLNHPDTNWLAVDDIDVVVKEGKKFLELNNKHRRGIGSAEAKNLKADLNEVPNQSVVSGNVTPKEQPRPTVTTTTIGGKPTERKPATIIPKDK